MPMQSPSSSWEAYYRAGSRSIGDYLRSLAAHAPLFDAVIERKPHRILEVGSGTGIMAIFLSWLGYEVVSIDNDRGVLADAEALTRALHGSCRYQTADAFRLAESFGDASFDVAFSQGFFEHFSDEDIHALVAQQLAVSRTVLISVPSFYYRVRDFGNERLLLQRDWRNILDRFPLKSITGYHPRLRGIKSLLKDCAAPWRLVPWRQTEHWLIRIGQ